jgi:hypothetical protein
VENRGNNDSIIGLVTRLIDDVERFVRAEVSLYRAQMLERVNEARGAIVMLVIAFMLAQATLFTFLVALVLIMRRWVGIYWASGIVVILALAVTLILAKAASARLVSATRVSEGDE